MTGMAVLFDLDGVISDTASVHAKAWKSVFDDMLEMLGPDHTPFLLDSDYQQHVDGKSRLTGIENFLHSRNIKLELGTESDTSLETVMGIGNRKNEIFRNLLEEEGVEIFEDARELVNSLDTSGVNIAIASSSKNAVFVLESGGMKDRFNAIMDGVVADENGVASKPSPQFYTYAASLVGLKAEQCIVIEDAISGVVSAKQAGAGVVVGLARNENHKELSDNGADIVVSSLNELSVEKISMWPGAASIDLKR